MEKFDIVSFRVSSTVLWQLLLSGVLWEGGTLPVVSVLRGWEVATGCKGKQCSAHPSSQVRQHSSNSYSVIPEKDNSLAWSWQLDTACLQMSYPATPDQSWVSADASTWDGHTWSCMPAWPSSLVNYKPTYIFLLAFESLPRILHSERIALLLAWPRWSLLDLRLAHCSI